METPSSSTRRVTRSQTRNIPLSSRKMEDSEKSMLSKSRQRNAVLVDITNDSPIVGLASGKVETPSSWMAKRIKNTQGSASGEALLRGQVKTLLQKVEEEAELSKTTSLQAPPFLPLGILAPANTPLISNLDQHSVSEVVNEGSPESEKNQLSRSLLLDFSDKSESSFELTYKDKPITEEDEASVWSIQVNASTHDEEIDDYYEEGDYYDEDEGFVDELCEGLKKMSVKGPEFEGKHTRFVYNSDDELVGEEQEEDVASPSVLRLKGLPTPKGKHLRFPEEEQDKKDMAL